MRASSSSSADSKNRSGDDQSERTINILPFLYSVVPALGLGGAILLIAKFPITEERAYEIREALKARKSAAE